METIQMFREIVGEADISDIPVKYIAAVTIIDPTGGEAVVTGEEDITKILRNQAPYQDTKRVNFLFDIRLLAWDMAIELSDVWTRVFEEFEKGRKK